MTRNTLAPPTFLPYYCGATSSFHYLNPSYVGDQLNQNLGSLGIPLFPRGVMKLVSQPVRRLPSYIDKFFWYATPGKESRDLASYNG